MQGGLVTESGQGQASVTVTGQPAPTGSPAVPQPTVQTTSQPVCGSGPGVTSTVDVGELGPFERLLAGSSWDRQDVNLALQTVSTLILLYWVYVEVQ
mgnify:CR=1 FL=1